MRLTRRARLGRPPSEATGADRLATAVRLRQVTIRVGLVVALAGMILVGVAAAPEPASAATVRVVAVAGSVSTVLSNIRNWIMGILASVATVFLTIGGLRYVIANGDPGEVQKAKTAFKSAALGYGLAALAPLVVTVLQGIVGS